MSAFVNELQGLSASAGLILPPHSQAVIKDLALLPVISFCLAIASSGVREICGGGGGQDERKGMVYMDKPSFKKYQKLDGGGSPI